MATIPKPAVSASIQPETRTSAWSFLSALLLVTILVFSGCSKKASVSEEDLYGRWKATDGYFYIFNEDLSGRTSDADDEGFDFTWKLTDNELTLRILGNGQTDKVAYMVFDIKSLDGNRMVCVDINEPGTDITFTRQ